MFTRDVTWFTINSLNIKTRNVLVCAVLIFGIQTKCDASKCHLPHDTNDVRKHLLELTHEGVGYKIYLLGDVYQLSIPPFTTTWGSLRCYPLDIQHHSNSLDRSGQSDFCVNAIKFLLISITTLEIQKFSQLHHSLFTINLSDYESP